MGINPFSLEDDSYSKRNGIQRSAFPKMQLSGSGSRFYVKTTRSGGGRKYFRERFSIKAQQTKTIVKSSFIRRNKDSTRHIIQHVDYMMKSKTDREREPDIRKLFDRDGQEITREEGIDMAMRNKGDVAGHKLILSPGINDIDLVDYAKDQMRVLEERLGVKMEYSFAYQKNTDNYHIHVQVPGRGDRILDSKNSNRRQRIEIKLGKDDFAAMREAGDKYIAKHMFLDKATDKIVELDLLRDTHGPEARKRQSEYDRSARRDLGLELTPHDYDVLKELGIEMPYRSPSYKKEKGGKPKPENKIPARDLGDAHFSSELVGYLNSHEYQLSKEFSDADVARTKELLDKNPSWIFFEEGKDPDEHTLFRSESLKHVKDDSRYSHFVKGIDSLVRMQRAELNHEDLLRGQKNHFETDDFHRISIFFKSEEGQGIYRKFLETQEPGQQTPESFEELNQYIDNTINRYGEKIEEKYGLSQRPDSGDRELEPLELSETVLRRLGEREGHLADYTRVLGYRTSGDFAESFERYIRLSEGKELVPEFENDNHRLAFLADKLLSPDYADQREHADLLRQRGVQTFSSNATRDELSSAKDQIRESQFALDSKIYELNEMRLVDFNYEYEQREMQVPKSRYEGAAENNRILYGQAIQDDNSRLRDTAQSKFHQAVMKHDDETLLREESILPQDRSQEVEQLDPEPVNGSNDDHSQDEFEADSEFSSMELEFREALERDSDDLVQGHSLPLPGFDLDRLDRSNGEELTHDPTEIQVSLTVDDELRRQRGDEEEGMQQT